MACREYGEGRIFIHTDRIGGYKTGHGDNPKEFWRKILEWTSKKNPDQLIRLGLVINTQPAASDKIHSFKPISVKKLSMSDLATQDLSQFDCIYFVGLSQSVSSKVTQKIKTFVENGGGLAIEYPNRGGEYINILRSIEDLYCYSSERPLTENAYWTIDGGNHYVFYNPAEISFMSTLRQSDFSASWDILMTNIQNFVTTTTTTAPDTILDFDQHSGSEFAVSFISSMQDGVAFLEPEGSSTSSSSTESTSSSLNSSSSSSENVNWNLCDNIVAEWTMDDNDSTPFVHPNPNNFLLTGKYVNSLGDVNTQDRTVVGKLNKALNFDSSLQDYISTQPNTILNFSNGINDLPFSVSFWMYCHNVSAIKRVIRKNGSAAANWELLFLVAGELDFYLWDTGSYICKRTAAGVIQTNRWYHVITTYDGSATTGGMHIYLDGSLADSTATLVGYVKMNNDSAPFYMSYPSDSFDGYMDQIVVFDKALSDIEIEALYNLGRGTVDCEGEYWHTSSSSSSYIENWSSSSMSSMSSSSSSP